MADGGIEETHRKDPDSSSSRLLPTRGGPGQGATGTNPGDGGLAGVRPPSSKVRWPSGSVRVRIAGVPRGPWQVCAPAASDPERDRDGRHRGRDRERRHPARPSSTYQILIQRRAHGPRDGTRGHRSRLGARHRAAQWPGSLLTSTACRKTIEPASSMVTPLKSRSKMDALTASWSRVIHTMHAAPPSGRSQRGPPIS